jgi:hypothetical protein
MSPSVSELRLGLRASAVLIAVALSAGCEIDPAQYRFGTNITGIAFRPYSENVGVHPFQDVLLDPENPFVETGVGTETKWEILADGGDAGAFYAWATLLATAPNGEHQFYAASKLKDIYQGGELDEATRPQVRRLAIRAFQSMLDHFPDAVTFDATGTTSFRLATPAYRAIVDLGAKPLGDWVLVTTDAGGVEAVQGSTTIGPPPAPVGEDDR